MQKFFQRVLHLQPGEGALIFALGFLLFGNSLARQVSSIVAVSGFLDSGGVNQMLLVMLIDYTFVLAVGGLQSLVVDRFNRIKLMGAISIGFAVLFVILRVLFSVGAPGWLNYAVMYLISEQQFIIFPVIFWVLANDVYSFAQAKRLFPLIASWSFIGKLLGIGVAAISPTVVSTFQIKSEDILWFNAAIYFVAYLIVITRFKRVNLRPTLQQTETMKETLTEGWDFLKGVASFRFMMITILALAIADTIIEFRFLVVTDTAFGDNYQVFYSLYRLGVTLVSFLVQTFLTSRLINGMQLKNVFLIFPIVILLGAVGTLAFPGVIAIITAMITVKLVRETVDDSGRKNFQSLVPEERRGRVSTFMDNYLPAVGTILACVVTGAIVLLGIQINKDLHLVYLAVSLICGGVAFWAVLRMRKVYEASLLNWRLKRRQRSSDSMVSKLSELL